MDRRGLPIALSVLALGCNEYSINTPSNAQGRGEPAPLQTPRKVDEVQQVEIPQVDVLWVIDDSCSMQDEQRLLSNNFASFIGFFIDSGLDWHVGVVSTDMDGRRDLSGRRITPGGLVEGAQPGSGQTFRFLDRDTPAPVDVFGDMSVLGTGGSATERGLDAAYAAIASPGSLATLNAGFYREDAALHVIVISDEQDQSGTRAGGYAIADSPSEFSNWLQTLKPNPDLPVTFSSIVTPQNDRNCPEVGDAKAGTRYLEVTRALEGSIEFSICEQDWQPVLEQLGLLAAGLKSEFYLSEVPVVGTIEIYFELDGKTWNGIDTTFAKQAVNIEATCQRRHDNKRCFGFTYDPQRNAVRTSQVIDQLARIFIEYDVLGDQQPDAAPVDTAEAAE